MIAFLVLCYCGVIWLVFFKLGLLPWNRATQALVAIVGTVAVFLLIVLMNLHQPQAISAVVAQRVTPIVARVSGRVVEVPVKPNALVARGDVLLRLDPDPYQAEVDRLQAAVAEAIQAVPQLEAALDQAVAATAQARAEQDLADFELERVLEAFANDAASELERDRATQRKAASDAAVERATAMEAQARLAYRSEINGENTTVAQLKAQLRSAEINLEECTIRAPADGAVTQLFVAPGAVTLTAAFSSVMTFLYNEELLIRASFRPNAARFMAAGDEAEIVFETIPGRVFQGEVVAIIPATGAGALSPSGTLLSSAELSTGDLVLTRIRIDPDQQLQRPPAGTACAVAVYADSMKPIRIIRKVVIRIQAWLAYL